MQLENRLLIVDDDPEICNFFSYVAADFGLETRVVKDSRKLLDTYRAFQPDAIVLDLNMPGTDGIEALQTLADANCKAAIILCSGTNERIIDTAARIANAHGLSPVQTLQKPIDLHELEAVLEQILPRAAAICSDVLRAAVNRGEIAVHYQPKVTFAAEGGWAVTGIEALARWSHPQQGPISPSTFIPLAEKCGCIRDLTDRVVDRAVHDTAKLHHAGHPLDIAVNLSPTLAADADYPNWIADRLNAHGLDSSKFIVEITESAALDESASVMSNLARFRLKGMRLSLDDFGTGYSSIALLHKLPFNEIKIDRSFVLECDSDPHAQMIIRLIVSMGLKLGLTVCAEGVETAATMEYLRSIDCQQVQGFFVSKPLPFEELLYFLRAHGSDGTVQYHAEPALLSSAIPISSRRGH